MTLLARNAPTIFTPQRAAKEAQRARKMESVYFVGQQKAWDGRAVLTEVLEKYPVPPGGQRLAAEHRSALAQVFSILMWGELAAWRVAAQLADQMPDDEMRLAATAQAHDEARHYYVLHDYLQSLAVEVPPLDRHTRSFLNAILGSRHVLHKVVGMQLFVETIALTMFKMVREANVDPALAELLTYYERDEARHVGFGVQAAPILMEGTGLWGRVRLAAFEARVLLHMLRALQAVEPDLRRLGVEARQVLEEGGRRFAHILDDYRAERGRTSEGQLLGRAYAAVLEWAFPPVPVGWVPRLRATLAAFRGPSALA